MNRTRKQTIVGILNAITGILGSITGAVIFFLANTGSEGLKIPPVFLVAGVILTVLAILSLVGGLYTFHGRKWSLALTGAVCSAIVFPVIGIPAIILISLARNEFY